MSRVIEPTAEASRQELERIISLARGGDRAPFHDAIWKDWEVLHRYLTSFVLDNAGKEFIVPYVNDALPRFLRTLDLLPLERGLEVLEFGANPYLFSILLERLLGYRLTFANFTGASIFDTEVTQGRQTISSSEYGEKFTFDYTSFNIELSLAPYPEGSFDVVLFCEILEHLVIDPLVIFPKFLRLLKPGGSLLLTTPNAVRLVNFAYMLEGANFFDRYHPENGIYGRHNREFTVGEIERILDAAGFVNSVVTTADRYDYDRILIDKDNYEEPGRLPHTGTSLEALLKDIGAVTENRGDSIYAVAQRPAEGRLDAGVLSGERVCVERGSLRPAGDGKSRIPAPVGTPAGRSAEARIATSKPSSTAIPRPAVFVQDPDPLAREDAPLAAARRLGEAEAEVADLQLRLKESHTRERRLLETTLELQEAIEQAGRIEQELRQQIDRYATYHRAVERSAAWRFVQFLRKLIGRKW